MKCAFCEQEATVHLTDVSNNAKQEIHLCEDCAEGYGATIKSHLNKDDADFPEFKAHALMAPEPPVAGGEESEIVCPGCGITYSKFRATGKFGCPQDYEAFGTHVVQLLEKIHHKVQHAGKLPDRTHQRMAKEREIEKLQSQLREAIDGERYEQAAEIRDKINSLETGSGK